MKVHELAKELSVENDVIMEITSKTSHLNTLSDAEEALVRGQVAAQGKEEKKELVRFVSEIRRHVIDGGEKGNLRFDKYGFTAYKGSEQYNMIMKSKDIQIMVILDKPFEGDEEVAKFDQMLRKRIFTGPNNEASVQRGMLFLEAMFSPEERRELRAMLDINARIQRALRTKSYRYISAA